VNKYARLKNMSIVYVCLVVRSYFLAQAETDLAFANMMLSRANLCEVLAMKLLSRFATNYIQLVAVLTTSWNPLTGANQDVIQEVKQSLNAHDDDMGSVNDQSAIEVRQIVPLIAYLTGFLTNRWLFPQMLKPFWLLPSLKRSSMTFIPAGLYFLSWPTVLSWQTTINTAPLKYTTPTTRLS
jgi:hypothetical protein